jgi:hypothetical protein
MCIIASDTCTVVRSNTVKTTTQLLLVKFNMADLLGKLVANYLV